MRARSRWFVALASCAALSMSVALVFQFTWKPAELIIPELTGPIKIVFGARFLDGGSTAVCLVGANDSDVWLVTPASLDADEKGLINGNLYVGNFDKVLDGHGTMCAVPSESATKIAGYLELAILNVEPTFDVRFDQRLQGQVARGPRDLSSAKWILQRIRVLEAEDNTQPTPMK